MGSTEAESTGPSSSKSTSSSGSFWQSPSMLASMASSILLWLSFAPVGFWPLAWLAPAPLFWLISQPVLPGRKPVLAIWFSGWVYWLATFYFIPLPHWALFFGWLTVSTYMSLYTLLLLGSIRTLHLRWRVPLFIAAPVAWTGIEWIRCTTLTGMGMACLSHSQFQQPMLIQVADLAGAYTLTFLMTMFAALIVSWPGLPGQFRAQKTRFSAMVGSALILVFILVYGSQRLGEDHESQNKNLRLLLVQGSIDANLNAREQEMEEKFVHYRDLTHRYLKDQTVDIVVWPEGSQLYELSPNTDLSQMDPAIVSDYRDAVLAFWQMALDLPNNRPLTMIVGGATLDPVREEVFNSAILVNDQGVAEDRYAKIHLVMYGEYFPILNAIPGLKEIFRGINRGDQFKTFQSKGIRIAPSVCFETTVAHLIRWQVNELTARGEEPDFLLNVTNDGWFYGTSCLDHHLACNVFRAVENHKPNFVCANTGFSAEINSRGQIIQQGPRRDTQALYVSAGLNRQTTVYRKLGDIIWIVMGSIVAITASVAWFTRKKALGE